jgi:hypothetical protein
LIVSISVWTRAASNRRQKSPAVVGSGTRDAQGVQVRLVAAERLQVCQAVAAAHDVVGDVQDVVGLVVRQVDLQQVKVAVDGVDQPDPPGQQVHGTDPAAADGPRAIGHVVVDVPRRQHRPGAGLEGAGPVPAGDAALASEPLPACTVVHSKRLLACTGQKVLTTLCIHEKAGVSSLFLRDSCKCNETHA